MLEILVCDDYLATKELYEKNGIEFNGDSLAVRAMFGEECLGYCLFKITGADIFVYMVEPEEDTMLSDGLLRSALHVGNERGITNAYYLIEEYESLYEKINFLENREEKRLKLNNLFTECQCCSAK